MSLIRGFVVLALAVIVGTCAMLVAGPRWLAAWCVVVAYVMWPAVWPVAKLIVKVPVGVLMPAPVGKVFPDPELLGVKPTWWQLEGLKTRVARWLASFVEIGLWPAAGLTGRTLHTVSTGSARIRYPRLGIYAVISAVFAVVLIGGRTWAGTSIAVTVAAIGLLTTITARHLLWILSGESFRLLLKRSLPDPYVALVVLAVFDYIALVAIAVVLRWKPGDRISLNLAIAESRDLLELRHLTNLLQQPGLSPVVVCLALAAAAYWASLASQVLKFTSFRRGYDDRAWLAALTLQEGSAGEASKLLEPVPREHISGPVLQMRIRLALARSDLGTARSQARALYNQLDAEHATEDGATVYLAKQISSAPVKPDDAWSIVQQGRAANISDGAMFAALRQMRSSGIARMADWESRARASGLTPESYPISWSWLLGSTGSMKDAERTLERTQPANEWDAAVRQVALWTATDEQRLWPRRRIPTRSSRKCWRRCRACPRNAFRCGCGISSSRPRGGWRTAAGDKGYLATRSFERSGGGCWRCRRRRQRPSSKTSIPPSARAYAHPRQPGIICWGTSGRTEVAARKHGLAATLHRRVAASPEPR